jgi:hypothetical protein
MWDVLSVRYTVFTSKNTYLQGQTAVGYTECPGYKYQGIKNYFEEIYGYIIVEGRGNGRDMLCFHC